MLGLLRGFTALARQPELLRVAASGLPCQPLSLLLLTGSSSNLFSTCISREAIQIAAGITSRPPEQPNWPSCQHSLVATRGFAAKGGAAAAGTDAPKKRRRGDNRLYSCRNGKVKSMFEQIWPTMQLTDEEAQLFRRNSRVFVTDMGKSIQLKTKFAMAKEDPHQKVPHQDARSLIYESDLHLDAVGEHPRYLKIRRLRAGNFAGKLQAVRKLRLLLGFSRRLVLQKLYELSRLQPGPDRIWKLICAMEGTLGMTTLRMGMAHDAVAAQGMLNRCTFHVNGVRPLQPRATFIQPGDVISPGAWAGEWHRKYMASQLGARLVGAVEQSWWAEASGAAGDGGSLGVAGVTGAVAGRASLRAHPGTSRGLNRIFF